VVWEGRSREASPYPDFDYLIRLRFPGPGRVKAAHDVHSDVSWEDTRDLVEFTEALLEYVVVFRERFERFKARQSGSPEKPRSLGF
jgi:hypothetical protein